MHAPMFHEIYAKGVYLAYHMDSFITTTQVILQGHIYVAWVIMPNIRTLLHRTLNC